MAMSAAEIETLIAEALPGAIVEITDLRGDGDHYSARVAYEGFRGMPRVKQHQMVYNALQGRMGEALHALALQTLTPESE
jgi:stress-induced morphogen